MADILMAPEKVPSRFSMADEGDAVPPPAPLRTRLRQALRDRVDRLVLMAGPHRGRTTNAAAW